MAWHTFCAAIREKDFKVAASLAERFPDAYAEAVSKLDGFPLQVAEAERRAKRAERHAKRYLIAAVALGVLTLVALIVACLWRCGITQT